MRINPMTSTPHLRSRGTVLVALAVLLVAAGCNSYKVTVDSLARENAEQAISYRIQSKKSSTGNDVPRPEDAAAYVKTALSGRGFYEAQPSVKADLVVEIEFGLGPRITRSRKVMEPVYSARVPSQPRRFPSDSDGLKDPFQDRTLFRETIISTTTYEKYLRLTAREDSLNSNGRPPNEIWTIDVTSTGESADLSQYLPLLVAASIEYIGRDTHGQKTIKLKDSDADVLFVKKGM